MKKVVFTPAGMRQWIKLTADVRRRIDKRLIEFAESGKGDVKRLRGRDGARLRIGDWRLIFYEAGDEIAVVTVGHRREIYD